ncbi:MAG: hypothetical protein ACLQM6_07730 [Acidobacteriaceae bacterium]
MSELWFRRLSKAALACLFAVSVAIRLALYFRHYTLGLDEATLAINLRDGTFRQLFSTLPYYDIACPLGYLIGAKTLGLAFGWSDWTVRLLPLLASLVALSVLFFSKIVTQFEKTYVLLLLTVSPLALDYSFEGKQYGTELTLSLLFCLATYRMLRRPGKASSVLFLLTGALGAVSITGFPIVLVGAMTGLWFSESRGKRIRFMILAAVPGIIFGIYYLFLFRPALRFQRANYALAYQEFRPPLRHPLLLLHWVQILIYRLVGLAVDNTQPFQWRFELICGAVFFLAPPIYFFLRNRGRDFFVTGWIAILAATLLLSITRVIPASQSRYFLFLYPWFCFAIAQSYSKLVSRVETRVLACLLTLLFLHAFINYMRAPVLGDAHQTLLFFQKHSPSSLPYVVTDSAEPFMDFYFPILGHSCISDEALIHGYVNRCTGKRPEFSVAAGNLPVVLQQPGAWGLQPWILDEQKNDGASYWRAFDQSGIEQRYDEYLITTIERQSGPALLVYEHSSPWYIHRRETDLRRDLQIKDLITDPRGEVFIAKITLAWPFCLRCSP